MPLGSVAPWAPPLACLTRCEPKPSDLRLPVAPFPSSHPTLPHPHSVDVTVIDKAGRRHALRGVVGENLAELLAAQVEAGTLEEDAVVASPEGAGAVEAHVKVPNEMLSAVPAPEGDDARWLSEVAAADSVDVHSRLASRIVLDKGMQGSLVALADHYPYRTL